MRWIERAGWRRFRAVFAACALFGFGVLWAQTGSVPGNPQPVAPSQPSFPQMSPQPPAIAQRPLVMLDPAHGGTESGAVLTPTILEKDVTLSFARRLRQDLTSHGIVVEMVRDADSNISTDDRAAKANAEHPLLYICLHASSLIGSTKLFSPVLQSADSSPGPFTAWDTAQQGSLSTGRALEQQLLPAFQKSGLSVRALEVAMRPLNNVTAPAIAIELAPRNAEISQLMSADYQAPISAAIATGIADSIPFLTASPTPSR